MNHKPFYPLKQEIAPLLDGRMTAIVRPMKSSSPPDPGTALWCKESFVLRHKYDRYYYHADHLEPYTEPYAHDGWKSPVLMPKSACRLWLEVVDVKVEKIHGVWSWIAEVKRIDKPMR